MAKNSAMERSRLTLSDVVCMFPVRLPFLAEDTAPNRFGFRNNI